MAIECYNNSCRHHDGNEPFCYESECTKKDETLEEQITRLKQENESLRQIIRDTEECKTSQVYANSNAELTAKNLDLYKEVRKLKNIIVDHCDPIDVNEGHAHELWALAQLMPEEGIEDGVNRILEYLTTLEVEE